MYVGPKYMAGAELVKIGLVVGVPKYPLHNGKSESLTDIKKCGYLKSVWCYLKDEKNFKLSFYFLILNT